MTETNPSILDKIVEQWENDAKIDQTNISGEILRTPNLFAKYIRLLSSWKQKRTAIQIKLNETKQLCSQYYRGELDPKMCQQKLQRNQWQGNKPLKSELEALLAADPAVTKIMSQLEMVDNIIYVLEQILNSIKSRDFALGTYTKYQMFLAGSK